MYLFNSNLLPHRVTVIVNTPEDLHRFCDIANIAIEGINPGDMIVTLLNKCNIHTAIDDASKTREDYSLIWHSVFNFLFLTIFWVELPTQMLTPVSFQQPVMVSA